MERKEISTEPEPDEVEFAAEEKLQEIEHNVKYLFIRVNENFQKIHKSQGRLNKNSEILGCITSDIVLLKRQVGELLDHDWQLIDHVKDQTNRMNEYKLNIVEMEIRINLLREELNQEKQSRREVTDILKVMKSEMDREREERSARDRKMEDMIQKEKQERNRQKQDMERKMRKERREMDEKFTNMQKKLDEKWCVIL